ncbi:uncharacterized protein LOC120347355 [Styela clava]
MKENDKQEKKTKSSEATTPEKYEMEDSEKPVQEENEKHTRNQNFDRLYSQVGSEEIFYSDADDFAYNLAVQFTTDDEEERLQYLSRLGTWKNKKQCYGNVRRWLIMSLGGCFGALRGRYNLNAEMKLIRDVLSGVIAEAAAKSASKNAIKAIASEVSATTVRETVKYAALSASKAAVKKSLKFTKTFQFGYYFAYFVAGCGLSAAAVKGYTLWKRRHSKDIPRKLD